MHTCHTKPIKLITSHYHKPTFTSPVSRFIGQIQLTTYEDVDVDRVYERRPKHLCPHHLNTFYNELIY